MDDDFVVVAATDPNILDMLSEDLLSMISYVSICILLFVFIIISFSLPSTTSTIIVCATTLIYSEFPSNSTSQKHFDALTNALVFVFLIAAVTFLILLYYYNFTCFLKNYTYFSVFYVLSSMGGSVLLSFFRSLHASRFLHHPPISLQLLPFGITSVFSSAFLILLKKSYMLALASIVAAWFTKLLELTTWILLLVLFAYDLHGSLSRWSPENARLISSTRNEELPTLVYKARPTVNPSPIPIAPSPD